MENGLVPIPHAVLSWMPRVRHLLLVLLMAALAGPALAAGPPHIIVILVDDMGYGDLRSYNPQSKISAPHIDRLAAEGMRFTDAHAPGPLCHPSRYGLMTGRYPFRTDISRWPTRPLVDEGQVTLPSMLRGAGYATAMVGKWHLGFAEDGYDKPLRGGPVDRGFDSFFGIRASTDIPPYFYIRGDRAVTPPTGHIDAGASPIQGAFWRAGAIAPDLEVGRRAATTHRRSDFRDREAARRPRAADAVPRLYRAAHALAAVARVHGQERRRPVRRFPDDGRP